MSDKPKKWTWEEWQDRDYNKAYDAFKANGPYIEWLESRIVELTNKCEEHEKTVSKLKNYKIETDRVFEKSIIVPEGEYQKEQETLAKLRESLEFYADPSSWIYSGICRNDSNILSIDMSIPHSLKISKSGGKKAREVLAAISEEI